MVAYTCNPRTRRQSQEDQKLKVIFSYICEFQAILGIIRPCFKNWKVWFAMKTHSVTSVMWEVEVGSWALQFEVSLDITVRFPALKQRQASWELPLPLDLMAYQVVRCFVLFVCLLGFFCVALSGCPGIYSVDQSGLRLRDSPASALGELGLKVYTTMLVCTHIHPLERVIRNRFLSLQTCY